MSTGSIQTLLLGIILAITASFFNNYGIVLQKKVVNAVPVEKREKQFFRTLGKKPIWLFGLFLQIGVSSICLLSAQYLIGPTLVPGLQGIGLVVLVVGSIRINNESLYIQDYIAILLLIIATGLTAASGLHIHIAQFDFQQIWFFRNAVIYSTVILVIFLILERVSKQSNLYLKSILLTMISGFLYALSDFWISPLVGTVGKVFSLEANWTEWTLFILASILLIGTNLFAIGKTQLAFKFGPASILIPLRHIPTLLLPVIVYYIIYQATSGLSYSLWFYLISFLLITLSSIILARHEERFSQDAAGLPAENG